MAGPARQVRGCHDALWGKSATAVCLLIGASRRCSEVLAFIRCLGCAIHAYAAVHACAVCCIMFQVDVSALETSTACKSDVTQNQMANVLCPTSGTVRQSRWGSCDGQCKQGSRSAHIGSL